MINIFFKYPLACVYVYLVTGKVARDFGLLFMDPLGVWPRFWGKDDFDFFCVRKVVGIFLWIPALGYSGILNPGYGLKAENPW